MSASCNTLHWQIDEINNFDLLHLYLCSASSRYPSWREAWTTPSLCLRSRWHVCLPTPSSAPFPVATPESLSTPTTQTSTFLGNVCRWYFKLWCYIIWVLIKKGETTVCSLNDKQWWVFSDSLPIKIFFPSQIYILSWKSLWLGTFF